jgi:antirestriction protein
MASSNLRQVHTDFRVWVGSMGAYNSGILLGKWVLVEAGLSELVSTLVDGWHNDDPLQNGDEWFIADHEGFGSAWPGGEWPNLDELVELAEAIEELGDPFRAFLSQSSEPTLESNISTFHDCYFGEWDSLKDYAWHIAEDAGMIPEGFNPSYFDINAFIRDLECGDCWTVDSPGGVYVYATNY